MLTPHTIQDLYDTIGLISSGEVNFTIQSVPDIHPKLPFQSPVLRADYFSFILTKRGKGVYKLDDRQFPFGAQSLYFTNPGHVKSYELHESKETQIIMVTESFLRRYVDQNIYEEFPFLLAEIVPPHQPEASNFLDYQQLFSQMEGEFGSPSKYKDKILGNLMLVLFLKIKEKFWADYNPIEEGKNNSRTGHAYGSVNWKMPENWREMLQLPGALSLKHLITLMYQVDFTGLAPDWTGSLITKGAGQYASNDYSVAAFTAKRQGAVVYIPSGRQLSFDLNLLSGRDFEFVWYDPRKGETTYLGSYTQEEVHDIKTPTDEDWVLLINAKPED